MTPRSLPLPDRCAVRLIDLDHAIGGLLCVDEDGFVNIYLNARLSHEARRRALQHELAHYYRDDLFNDRDIREIERDAAEAVVPSPAPPLLAMDGSPLRNPAPAFDTGELKRVGRGLYLPEGVNLAKAGRDLAAIKAPLAEACLVIDVMQRPPLVSVARLRAACAALSEADIAFVGWMPEGGGAPPAVMHFCRDGEDRLRGAIYYAADGGIDSAIATLELTQDGGDVSFTIDLRRRGGTLAPHAIHRDIDAARYERLY